MTTRGMVLVNRKWEEFEGPYELYYDRFDSHPTRLGAELIKRIKNKMTVDEIINDLNLYNEHKSVSSPEDAYLRVKKRYLEWIYVIRHYTPSKMSLQILKTSNLKTSKAFVFSVWYGNVDHFPDSEEEVKSEMRMVELMAGVALNCVAAYAQATRSK